MAVSVDASSPGHLHKGRSSYVGPSPSFHPSSSDKRIWTDLRSLQNRRREKIQGESDGGKRWKEDSQLLLRGFDSIADTLSQFSSHLNSAVQGARDLAKRPTLTEAFCNKWEKREDQSEGEDEDDNEGKKNLKRKSEDNSSDGLIDDDSPEGRHWRLKKAKNLAAFMATKAASIASELKSIKSELGFMQERCCLLEEENRRLRDGLADGVRPEEDDLVRLQLETLLNEKSRLANENANLMRENQCLKQLVEYHQLASHDLSPYSDTYPEFSPRQKVEDDEASETPISGNMLFPNSIDEWYSAEQQ